MNIEDMIKNMNPQMLKTALEKAGSILSKEQTEQVANAIKSIDKGELSQKLGSLNSEELKKEVSKNPDLAKKLSQNPELMKKINQIFNK